MCIYIGNNGKENGNYYSIIGCIYIYRGNDGKENGNYYSIIGCVYIYIEEIMEKKMETIIFGFRVSIVYHNKFERFGNVCFCAGLGV